MSAHSTNVTESRSNHKLGAASPAGVGQAGIFPWRARRGAPELVLYIVNYIRHEGILNLCKANL